VITAPSRCFLKMATAVCAVERHCFAVLAGFNRLLPGMASQTLFVCHIGSDGPHKSILTTPHNLTFPSW
jgi:hypothetical protein